MYGVLSLMGSSCLFSNQIFGPRGLGMLPQLVLKLSISTLGGATPGSWATHGVRSSPPSLPEAPPPQASLSSYWPALRWPPSGLVGFFPHLSFRKLAPALPVLSSAAILRGHTFGLCWPSCTS